MKYPSFKRLRIATLMVLLAAAIAACGLDKKFEETLNPPEPDKYPVALISETNQTVNVGDTVLLDGSSSYDPQKSTLTFAWTLDEKPNGSAAALSAAATPVTTFVADKGGYYNATLTLTNAGGLVGQVATVRVSAVGTGFNHPPVANAGADIAAKTGVVVLLDGTASVDADDDTLDYAWTLIDQPATSTAAIVDSILPVAWIDPDVAGTYTVELAVSDRIDYNVDALVITVTD